MSLVIRFLILKLFQHEWKEMWFLFSYVNFINKIETKPKFTLRYFNFYKSLISNRPCLQLSVFLILNFFNMSKRRCDPFVPYINFINETKKRCYLFIPCLNFIKENEKESRFILIYLNFYKSLIPSRFCHWFLKVKQRCGAHWNFLLLRALLNLFKRRSRP